MYRAPVLTSDYYRGILKNELARRCGKNGNYSLRAFARSIGMDASGLSRVLKGKEPLSIPKGRAVSENLLLSPYERKHFLASVSEGQKERKLKINRKVNQEHEVDDVRELEEETFKVISKLYHYGIIELTNVRGFCPEPKWMANRLGISEIEAKFALERLLKLGLLKQEEGTYKKTNYVVSTPSQPKSSASFRRHQKQAREAALVSLENDPIESRCMLSGTMAIDPGKIEIARKMLMDFMRSFCEVMATGDRTEVYQLTTSFFSLERSGRLMWKNEE